MQIGKQLDKQFGRQVDRQVGREICRWAGGPGAAFWWAEAVTYMTGQGL